MRLYALDTLDKINDTIPARLLETDGYKMTHASIPPEAPTESPDPVQGGSFQNARGETMVLIPSAEVLTQRLETYVGGAIVPYMAQKLYPRLLKMAGRKLLPRGVAVGLTLATYDACEGLPPMVSMAMTMNFPEIVSALVPDETLHAEILEALNG
jgi:hypothetical protein